MKRKIISILFALVLVLSFSLIPAMPAMAATTWYVDDDTCPAVGDGSVGTPFCSIQDAIDAAVSGDTINVAAGTYDESVTVDKALTLLGAKANVDPRGGAWTGDITTINAGAGNNGILITASGVTVNGFKVTESGAFGGYIDYESGIHVFSGGSELTDIVIKNCWCDANYGSGILVEYAGSPIVEYNYCSNNGDPSANIAGIAGRELTGGFISNNECFNNTNYGIYLGGRGETNRDTSGTNVFDNELHSNGKYGIQIIGHGGRVEQITLESNNIHDNGRNGMKLTNATDCVIEGNHFTSNGFGTEATSDKYRYGVMLSTYSYSSLTENTSLTGNTFSGNNLGSIYMYEAEASGCSLAGTVAHFNNFIEGSGKWGINNTSAYLVDATCNWWGDPSGPGGEGPGSGDAVSSNVDFVPWLSNPWFHIDEAKLDFKKKPDDDKVRIKGKLGLNLCGDGVDISDDVIVTVGLLSETITMVEKGKKGEKWEYKRPKDDGGNIKHMTIDWKNGKFEIRMDKADLTGVTNPVTISVQIGGYIGSESILMKEKKKHWDYKD